MTTGCGGDSGQSVPRPAAFHRIETPEASYDTLSVAGVTLLANSATSTIVKPSDATSSWIDIVYPSLGNATVYCSITPVTPATAESVIANRTERMALNSGGNRSEITEFLSPGGYDCRLMITGAGTATPVQFIASGHNRVVTGTLMLNVSQGFRPDSIAPVVDAVGRDMITLMENL